MNSLLLLALIALVVLTLLVPVLGLGAMLVAGAVALVTRRQKQQADSTEVARPDVQR